MNRRHVPMVVVAALAAQLSFGSAVRAGAGTDKMRWGVTHRPVAAPRGSGCSVTNRIWLQELGNSGTNRLRVRWELRSKYDNGYLPTYGKTGWARGGQFPRDHTSYWGYFVLPAGFLNFAGNKEFSLWTKMIGERPSFWQRDLVLKGNLGTIACDPSAQTFHFSS